MDFIPESSCLLVKGDCLEGLPDSLWVRQGEEMIACVLGKSSNVECNPFCELGLTCVWLCIYLIFFLTFSGLTLIFIAENACAVFVIYLKLCDFCIYLRFAPFPVILPGDV